MVTVRVDKSKKLDYGYSLFVSFPYNEKILDVIRTFDVKKWDGRSKEWELPLIDLSGLVAKLPWVNFDISGMFVKVNQPDSKIPDNFEFKTNPFEHQREGLEYGLAHNCWLLGDEQGLGKTKQVIDIAVCKKLQFGYKHCLIICGVNGLKWNWMNEIKTHSNEEGYILGMRQKKNGEYYIGSTTEKLCDAMNLGSMNFPYFIITNVETLRNKDICEELAKHCRNGNIGIVAADEVHKMKNVQSQQGKGFLELKPECKIAMTGTPLMNRPFDLYMILKWLGCESHTLGQFKSRYAEFGGYGGYEVIRYKNMGELQKRLDSVMLRRKKEEVLDLPEKTYVMEYVDMTPKQASLYREVRDSILANIDQVEMSDNPLANLIRLRQATGYTGILSSTVHESAKLDRLEELIQDNVDNGRKVIVFSNWTQMTDPAAERLQKMGVKYRVITGQTKAEDRMKYVEEFQGDNDMMVMLGSIGALGTGLTLTKANTVIFLDHPWNRALYDQCVDRAHRIGQTKNITVYNLMCKGTIDERIWEIVEEKREISDKIVDGNMTKMDRSKLVDFLLS